MIGHLTVLLSFFETFVQVVEDYSNRAIADSDSLDTSVQDILKTFDLEKSLTFDVSFDVLSELKWLAPYNNVKV